MIKNTYTVQFRRKRKGLTNYWKRLSILTSNKPRLVVRKSLKNIQAAIIVYGKKGDIVKVSSHSSNLKKFGKSESISNSNLRYYFYKINLFFRSV